MQIVVELSDKAYKDIEMDCKCIECDHKCDEYYSNSTSDKAYYEWTYKQDKCMQGRK